VSRVNIVKRIKTGGRWKMFSIPRNAKGNYDWNTILHNAVIVAQFLKRHGRSGITKELSLPERITPLVKIYRHEELARFFVACSDQERALFATFLLTGFREQEVMFLRWSDINFELRTVRVTSKPELGFYPKRWEDREIPAPVELIEELRKHTHRPNCQFVFPSPSPSAAAILRHVQCVDPSAGFCCVLRAIRACTAASATLGRLPLCRASSPSSPFCLNRCFQREIVGACGLQRCLDLLVSLPLG
jgi:hypothetical protein